MPVWTIAGILTWTESYFLERSIDSPRLTAELLLAYSLGMKRLDLYLNHDRPLDSDELAGFKKLIKKRTDRQPVAYITGEKGFYTSDFHVSKDVLIPRPDTETLVEQALSFLEEKTFSNRPMNIIDLGTGSGAIIVSLAREKKEHRYFATDVSCPAIRVAKKNAVKIADTPIIFFCSDWWAAVKKNIRFDLIVSNPPYIPAGDIQKLEPEIRNYEPVSALDGGKDGLDCFKKILRDAGDYLMPDGIILLEVGFDQKAGLEKMVAKHPGFQSVEFKKDLAGHDRVAVIRA